MSTGKRAPGHEDKRGAQGWPGVAFFRSNIFRLQLL